MCIQSAYKIEDRYDLVIIDEIHGALSPEYSKIFNRVEYKQLLGLTATIPHDNEYRELLQKKAPVVFVKTLDEAKELGAVSDFNVYNLYVPMSRKGRARYRKFDGMLKLAQMELGSIKRFNDDLAEMPVFEIAQKYARSTEKTPIVKWSKQFWAAMSMRK